MTFACAQAPLRGEMQTLSPRKLGVLKAPDESLLAEVKGIWPRQLPARLCSCELDPSGLVADYTGVWPLPSSLSIIINNGDTEF